MKTLRILQPESGAVVAMVQNSPSLRKGLATGEAGSRFANFTAGGKRMSCRFDPIDPSLPGAMTAVDLDRGIELFVCLSEFTPVAGRHPNRATCRPRPMAVSIV